MINYTFENGTITATKEGIKQTFTIQKAEKEMYFITEFIDFSVKTHSVEFPELISAIIYLESVFKQLEEDEDYKQAIKSKLIGYIDNGVLNVQACDLLIRIIEIENKSGRMKAAYKNDELQRVDSAMPQELAQEIKQLIPSFDIHNHVYDYNDDGSGQIVNLNDRIMQRLYELINGK